MRSLFCFLIFGISVGVNAQNLKLEKEQVFVAEEDKKKISKKILLYSSDTKSQKLVFFKTKLQVNTDGTPKSYHPGDIGGNDSAINLIGNGVAVYKNGSTKNLFLNGKQNYKLAKQIFTDYQKLNYEKFPVGYKIKWDKVLYTDSSSGKYKPCIIKVGKYAGYYGSMTSLENGEREQLEDCGCNNQINSLDVNGFVIPLGNNVLKTDSIDKGDLVVAYNSMNKKMVYAVVYDLGPSNKLGEGSVKLNMNLIDKTEEPLNYKQTKNYATPNEIHIVIIPNSRNYAVEKPFTNENIVKRAKLLLNEMGFSNNEDIVKFILANSLKLD
jgi:hypothetical protein